MKGLAMAVGFGAGLLLLAGGPADAQWRYTDAKGVTHVTQYKINVPTDYRDAAEWVGPVGVGKPALSAEQIRVARHWEAISRIVAAEAALLRLVKTAAPGPAPRRYEGPSGPPRTTMCIAGQLRAMTSPGSWKVVGGCSSGFSSDYSTDGYGTSGSITTR
jgi:hypothetical protein